MIRQTIIPTQSTYTINLPKEMIGKQIEITLNEVESSIADYKLNESQIQLLEEERIKIANDSNYLLDWDKVKDNLKVD